MKTQLEWIINIWIGLSKWGVTICALAGAYNIHLGRNDADATSVYIMAALAIFFLIKS